MSDDLVKRICQTWIDGGCADECFWEGWPECPTPEDILTPRMVFDRIEELEAGVTDMHEGLTTVYWSGYEDGKKAMEAKLAKVISAYRMEALRRRDYTHDAFDRHIAELTGEKT